MHVEKVGIFNNKCTPHVTRTKENDGTTQAKTLDLAVLMYKIITIINKKMSHFCRFNGFDTTCPTRKKYRTKKSIGLKKGKKLVLRSYQLSAAFYS